MDETYGVPQRAKWGTDDSLSRPDDSFASEAVREANADREVMAEQAEQAEPNDNTKMVM